MLLSRGMVTLVMGAALLSAGCSQRVGLEYAFDLKRPEGYVTQPNMGFNTGDRFRIRVMPEQDCWLYVIHQGVDMQYSMLFPLGQVEGGKNFVKAGHMIQIPSAGNFALDEKPGVEFLYFIAALQPVPYLETFRGRENPLDPQMTRAALKNINQVYTLQRVRHDKYQGPQFTHESITTRYQEPILKCDVEIIHQ